MSSATAGPTRGAWAIFLISALGLFLEMAMIRWISTEVRIFAYLQNTILLVCFLGLGLGCLTSREPFEIRQSLMPLGLLVLVLSVPLSREMLGRASAEMSVLGDLAIWYQVSSSSLYQSIAFVILGLAVTYVLSVLVLDTLVPVGRLLGRLLDDHPSTIWAYSVNLIGSLTGIWLFTIVSSLHQPPVVWIALVVALSLFFVPWAVGQWRLTLALLISILVLSWIAGLQPGSLDVIWSPYQKLLVRAADNSQQEIGQYIVEVNNAGYQMMDDLSTAHTASDPAKYLPELRGLSQYDIPLLLHPHPETYLIVGAGAGNDAAGGLRHGVARITAVEIDPAIISIGQSYHPEKPYASPRVQLVNDDARSFFATTDDKFDVIAFGLLDSHTTTAMTNARLDHYVYTRESIARAKSLLAPRGILVLSFEAQKPYIADRMARLLLEVFGEEPIAFRMPPTGYGWGGVLFISGDLEVAKQQIAETPKLAALIEGAQRALPLGLTYSTKVTTDDWPYLYLDRPRIPALYYVLAGLMVVIVIRSLRRWKASGLVSRWGRSGWHFFFLGAGFLLLEVQNISKASVILGNTWQVNAWIVSGVLVMALLANLLAHRWPKIPLGPVYLGLISACLGLYFVDLAQFAFLPYLIKALVVGSLTAAPMLFSGIIFIRSFASVTAKDAALGANMIGSVVGALLQSVTFVTGVKALLLIVACFYLLSLFTGPVTTSRARLTVPRL